MTPASHSDFDALELATKEITKVAERINVLKSLYSAYYLGIQKTVSTSPEGLMYRKEICDRILAKGRRAVSNINADLAKSFGRRTDKLRSSLGIRPRLAR